MATQPIDPIEEHIAQAMADPKFVASLEEIEEADERGELQTVSDSCAGRSRLFASVVCAACLSRRSRATSTSY